MSRGLPLVHDAKAVAALVLLLGLGACSAGADAAPGSTPLPTPRTAHLVVTTWRNGDDAMLSLRAGVLVEQSDGCVGMRMTSSAKPVLLRWPAGTRLADDGRGAVGLSGRRFGFGQQVAFGGGFARSAVPAACDPSLWASVFEVQQPL